MIEFATLINALDSSNKASLKKEAIIRFLTFAPEKDKRCFNDRQKAKACDFHQRT